MTNRIYRSITKPVRKSQTWDERWNGPDKGLIACWERGLEKRMSDTELASCAQAGQLMILPWRGGVEKKLEVPKKDGTLNYLAMWQGLRGEDLDICLDEERVLVCSKTGQEVTFRTAASSKRRQSAKKRPAA